jgi:hypothetical protein
VFDCPPSKLNKIYWTHSFTDLQRLVSMKIQYELMRFVQERETLREAIQEALGGSSSEQDQPPESFDEFAAIIASAGGAVHS